MENITTATLVLLGLAMASAAALKSLLPDLIEVIRSLRSLLVEIVKTLRAVSDTWRKGTIADAPSESQVAPHVRDSANAPDRGS